jgi:HEAT repeat protein
VEAAKALCAALPGATARQEYWRIAGALGRSAWPGAAPALTGAIRNPHDSSVRSSLAEALVRCGDVSYGLDILYAGLSDDAGSHDYASRLDRLDQDGIRDARLIPEITALLERTKSTNSKYIGREVIHRHQGE